MRDILIFSCEGTDHEIELIDDPSSDALDQLRGWLPTETTIHCAKIAGCHIYWPSPILTRLQTKTDINELPPGSFLYYPDRQYLEIIYDELQAETASVAYLGKLKGDVGWLREYATRQREQSGLKPFSAQLRLKGATFSTQEDVIEGEGHWARIRRARRNVWCSEPKEVATMLANIGHNIPLGPMATADAYFRCVQESLWQLWAEPDRFDDESRRAVAINSMELGISRIGHYCHLADSEAFLHDAIACVNERKTPLQDLLAEIILYCGRMSNWVDTHIPWHAANELTKKALGRDD